MEAPPNPEPSPTLGTVSFDLSRVYVHLGLGARAEALPDFTWSEEDLRRYEADHEADGDEGRLVMIGLEEATWTSWERHPAGDELVVALSGHQTLIQEVDGKHHRIGLHAGQGVVNPRGVWHTADVHQPGSALFITPGRGTQHRPRGDARTRRQRKTASSWSPAPGPHQRAEANPAAPGPNLVG